MYAYDHYDQAMVDARVEEFPDQARLINTDAVRTMAEICAARRVRMIHISTDFVFDGQTDTPYSEEDTPNPLSVYGRSKHRGEELLLEFLVELEDPVLLLDGQ